MLLAGAQELLGGSVTQKAAIVPGCKQDLVALPLSCLLLCLQGEQCHAADWISRNVDETRLLLHLLTVPAGTTTPLCLLLLANCDPHLQVQKHPWVGAAVAPLSRCGVVHQ